MNRQPGRRDNIERRAYEIIWNRWKQRQLCSVYQGQNVDSEEHVSTSKAVVDAQVEEWNQVDIPWQRTTVQNCATLPVTHVLPASVVPEGLVKAVRF